MNRLAYGALSPKGAQKTQNSRFLSKSALHVKKRLAIQFLCVNTISDKVIDPLAYKSVRKKFARAGRSLLRENLAETGRPTPSKTPISNQYSLVDLSRNT